MTKFSRLRSSSRSSPCRYGWRRCAEQAKAVWPVIAVALGDTFVRLTLIARMPTIPPETTSSS